MVSPVGEEEVEVTAAEMLTERGWKADHGPITRRNVSSGTWLARASFDLLGMWTVEGPWGGRHTALTPAGHATALAFLREVATGPRRNLR